LEYFSSELELIMEKAISVQSDDPTENLDIAYTCVDLEVSWLELRSYIETIINQGLAPCLLSDELYAELGEIEIEPGQREHVDNICKNLSETLRVVEEVESPSFDEEERENKSTKSISASVLADCQKNFNQYKTEYEQRLDVLDEKANKMIDLVMAMRKEYSCPSNTDIPQQLLGAMIDYRQEIDACYNLASILFILAVMLEKEDPHSLGEKNSEHYSTLKCTLKKTGNHVDQSLRDWIEYDYFDN